MVVLSEETFVNSVFRHFPDHSIMATLVVHPAYWKRGHGAKLVSWSMELSKLDQIPQGVSAAAMGAKLYSRLGYTYVARLEEKGDEYDPEGVYTELLRFAPESDHGIFTRIFGWMRGRCSANL